MKMSIEDGVVPDEDELDVESIAAPATLNGAQISAAMEIISAVTAGTLVEIAALELLIALGLDAERASAMVKASKDAMDSEQVPDEGKPDTELTSKGEALDAELDQSESDVGAAKSSVSPFEAAKEFVDGPLKEKLKRALKQELSLMRLSTTEPKRMRLGSFDESKVNRDGGKFATKGGGKKSDKKSDKEVKPKSKTPKPSHTIKHDSIKEHVGEKAVLTGFGVSGPKVRGRDATMTARGTILRVDKNKAGQTVVQVADKNRGGKTTKITIDTDNAVRHGADLRGANADNTPPRKETAQTEPKGNTDFVKSKTSKMPVSQLTDDEVVDELFDRGVHEDTIDEFSDSERRARLKHERKQEGKLGFDESKIKRKGG